MRLIETLQDVIMKPAIRQYVDWGLCDLERLVGLSTPAPNGCSQVTSRH